MPVYAYVCKNCQHAFDIRQAFTDDALTECPECGQKSLRKKFNTVGVSFKGSGFYSTDSKSSDSNVSGSSSSSGSSSAASSGE
ncbi:FmdB family zinc ribbon protein [uncultured Kocuria sp.]|mgnify:CR=1 FL=1|uniref:FmdB family zinc ribbon protein n=1 Tax=uncultured Kocuria sp. TaxID=259305 RepID=UPI00259483F4|nr:FmdB family zinc ribbon protein [uncultured Kocuria sp.]MCT1367255.1 FmdB family transcriptional regulator [Rothia sp. p3-SID1597]